MSVACVTNHICVITCVPSGLCMLTVWAVRDMSKEKYGDSKKENTQWCIVLTIIMENTSFCLFVVKSTCAGLHENILISQFHLIRGFYPFFSHIFQQWYLFLLQFGKKAIIFFKTAESYCLPNWSTEKCTTSHTNLVNHVFEIWYFSSWNLN